MTPKKSEWKPKFIEHLRETGNVSASAREAGVSRQAAYKERVNAPVFADEWDDAIEEGMDALEAEARRRAFEGVDKPITYQGEITDWTREYSDTLMIFLLKGRRREVFGDKVQQELAGARGGPIQIIQVGGTDAGDDDEGAISWP